jgi:hypothetical protein
VSTKLAQIDSTGESAEAPDSINNQYSAFAGNILLQLVRTGYNIAKDFSEATLLPLLAAHSRAICKAVQLPTVSNSQLLAKTLVNH